MIGQRILHYEILEKLGEGGMGVVFKAHDSRLEREVAIKFLPKRIATNARNRERFKTEAKAAATLNHPNIATIYAIEETVDHLFIVMEYIDGRELREIVDTNPLSIDRALNYALQIAKGLQAAHEKGVTHRDIKPANIMITQKGQVKIMDFGLAKVLGGAQITKEGTTVGTAAYMSPEQARGATTDRRSDIWSYGVVLYEMLTGQLPFKGEYEQVVIYSILNEEPELITEVNKDLPTSLQAIIKKTLTKIPEERYQKIEDLVRDLKDIQKSEELHVEPNGTTRKKRTNIQKLLIVGAGVLVLLAMIWGWLKFRSEPPESTAPDSRTAIAVLPFSVQGASDIGYLGEGMVNLLSTKLDIAGEMRSIDARALLSFVSREMKGRLSPEDGEKIASHFGARLYVMGDIVEASGRLQINAAIYERNHGISLLGESTLEGNSSQVFGLVDDLATQLLKTLTGQSNTRVTRLAAVTTASLSALKAYLEGENALRMANYETAVEGFQRAVATDTQFALAYYRLSVAAEWLLRTEIAHDAAQQAIRYADRLSERDHRLLEALLTYRQGNSKKAEEIYRSILSTYPDDVEAWIHLGEVLFHYNPLHGSSFTEARKPFERVLYFEPNHTASLIHLARISAAERQYSELDSLVQSYIALYPSGERVLSMQTLRAFSMDSPNEREQILTQLQKARDEDVALAVWNVGLYMEDLHGAEQLMRVLAESTRFSSEVQAVARAWLAHLLTAKGQWQQAKQELAELEKLDFIAANEYRSILAMLPFVYSDRNSLAEYRDALMRLQHEDFPQRKNPSAFFSANYGLHPLIKVYLTGLLSAQLGDSHKAAEYANKLVGIKTPPGSGSLASDLALSIQAQSDLHNGRNEQALMKLKNTRRQTWYELMISSPFYSQAYERFMLAELLFDLGREREALDWYLNLTSTSPFEIAYVPISYLRRGEIYDKLGDYEKAITHYNRFVEFWQDSDPELRPILDRAKKRIDEIEILVKK